MIVLNLKDILPISSKIEIIFSYQQKKSKYYVLEKQSVFQLLLVVTYKVHFTKGFSEKQNPHFAIEFQWTLSATLCSRA